MESEAGPKLDREPLVFVVLAGAALLLHSLGLTGYGYFRDELYYLECTRHLAWGYVDQPPFSIALLWVWKLIAGESLSSIRLLAAFAQVATVLVTAQLTRELGGTRPAMVFAGLAILFAPIGLALHAVYSMNAFETVFWALAALQTLRALRSGTLPAWAWLGLILGLGLLNKLSMSWFGMGLALGLILTRERRVLLTPGPWLAAAIAALLIAPHVVWQIAHGWPTLEFMDHAQHDKMLPVSVAQFALGQFLGMGPVSVLVWLLGLGALLVARDEPRRRVFAIQFLAIVALLLAQGTSRPNYLTPAYPILFAAGAVVITDWLAGLPWGWLRWSTQVAIVVAGLGLVPAALPVLYEPDEAQWRVRHGLTHDGSERHREALLGQFFADMHGWPAFADTVGAVFLRLTPEERAHCAIFAQNYGEASAINVLGRRYGMPRCLSGHNAYWTWGPGNSEPTVMIVVGGDAAGNASVFEELQQVAVIHTEWSMPYEQEMPVYLGRGLKTPLRELWPRLKHYD